MAQNPISCEPCRQKKCKCDRILPICSQCVTTPARCIYPESGKRGLPQGYITHIEHRLIDTEIALYTLYSQMRSAGLHIDMPDLRIPQDAPDTLARQSRTTNMSEWERLPLRDARDWERWWTEKNTLFGGGEFVSGPNPGENSREGDTTGERREGDTTLVPGGSFSVQPGDKADKLAETEPNVYF
ncbi:hypothetical protein BDV59DRAFT_45937 [Aspergillus ambiguus]|uniref:Zn(II)2Cys6 transcription factor domain-containing protein n=1 Tax=Aspergillus ambiguus TaxID=176160 RepID=UPI003CCD9AA1